MEKYNFDFPKYRDQRKFDELGKEEKEKHIADAEEEAIRMDQDQSIEGRIDRVSNSYCRVNTFREDGDPDHLLRREMVKNCLKFVEETIPREIVPASEAYLIEKEQDFAKIVALIQQGMELSNFNQIPFKIVVSEELADSDQFKILQEFLNSKITINGKKYSPLIEIDIKDIKGLEYRKEHKIKRYSAYVINHPSSTRRGGGIDGLKLLQANAAETIELLNAFDGEASLGKFLHELGISGKLDAVFFSVRSGIHFGIMLKSYYKTLKSDLAKDNVKIDPPVIAAIWHKVRYYHDDYDEIKRSEILEEAKRQLENLIKLKGNKVKAGVFDESRNEGKTIRNMIQIMKQGVKMVKKENTQADISIEEIGNFGGVPIGSYRTWRRENDRVTTPRPNKDRLAFAVHKILINMAKEAGILKAKRDFPLYKSVIEKERSGEPIDRKEKILMRYISSVDNS